MFSNSVRWRPWTAISVARIMSTIRLRTCRGGWVLVRLSWGHYGGPACEYASSLPSARPSSPFPSSLYPRSPPGTHPLYPSAGTQPHHPARTSLDTSPVSISKMSHSSFESTYDGRYDGMGAWGSVRWDGIGRGGRGTGPGAVMDVGRRRVGRSCCQRQ